MALGIRTLEQRMIAGYDFNGEEPTTEVVFADNLEAYPEDVVGGFFNLALDAPAFVRSIELKLGGQTFWTVHKIDKDASELLVACGTDETDFLTTDCESFLVTAKQSLIVRTTGATAKLIARIHLQSAV